MKLIDQIIPIRNTFGDGKDSETVRAHVINARWCAFRRDGDRGWSLTHRATGYSAGKGLRTFKAARALALALEKVYSPKQWTFTDPRMVSGMKKAKPLIEKHGAYL